MRNADSAYDTRTGCAITDMLAALTANGHAVETYITGEVEIDGSLWDPDTFDRAAMAWDGTDDGLEQLLGRHAPRDACDY
jgi:hypothetical protein